MRAAVAVAGLALLVGSGFVMRKQIAVMKSTGGPGIVPFEKARDVASMEAILDAWGEKGRAAARGSLLVDFAFVAGYVALTVSLACASAAVLRDHGWDAWTWLAVVSGLAYAVAGLLDVVENVLLLRALGSGGVPSWLPPVSSGAATAKFALVFGAVPFLLTAVVAAVAAP